MRWYRTNVLLCFSQLALRGEGPACHPNCSAMWWDSQALGGSRAEGRWGREGGVECNEALSILFLTRGYVYWFEREKHQPAASCTHPNQGLNPWPRYVPWSGIKLTTFMVYSHPAGAQHIILDHSLYPVTCFSQSKPDTGMFFSNNSFKCNSALEIVFEDCWSSFIAYLLSVYAPGPVIGYWGYEKKVVFSFLKNYQLILERKRERNIDLLFHIHWLIPVYPVTRDPICNLGVWDNALTSWQEFVFLRTH